MKVQLDLSLGGEYLAACTLISDVVYGSPFLPSPYTAAHDHLEQEFDRAMELVYGPDE